MTASRWLVSFMVVTALGSVAVGVGHPEIQTAEAHPAVNQATLDNGYCSGSAQAPSTGVSGRTDAAQPDNSTLLESVTSPIDASSPSPAVATRAESESATLQSTRVDARSALGSAGTSAHPASESDSCPEDMVEVKGDHCQVVEQICVEYISEKKDRCAKYRDKVRCFGKTTPVHVCVDRFEYPNLAGAKPTVAVTFDEASELCSAEGKRLCTADEWTQACEGPEHAPYAYGFERNENACNHDKPYIIPDAMAYQNPETRAAEVARLNQSEPSGSRASCVSAYGVFDMTGNVDEWVNNEAGSANGPEFQSGLKGGYWGPVRNRCRPMTTDHNHWHHGYQIGFRCCKDPAAAGSAPHRAPEGTSDSSVSDRAPETHQDVSRS